MKYIEFSTIVQDQINEMLSSQGEKILEASKILSESLVSDGIIHIFGCGHSQMFAQEMFYRAGGLVPVNPLIIPHLSLNPVAKLSTLLERTEGFVGTYLDLEYTTNKDTMIIVSVSGRNGAVVDMAIAAKKKGMKVIAITSMNFSENVPSRHSSGKKLFEYADIVIDLKCVFGDAVCEAEGFEYKFAGTSTIIGMLVIQSLVSQTIEECLNLGFKPPVWVSSNTEEGDDVNQKLIEKYKHIISCL